MRSNKPGILGGLLRFPIGLAVREKLEGGVRPGQDSEEHRRCDQHDEIDL